jgi:caffeoyl-CoA O-methyltransferase
VAEVKEVQEEFCGTAGAMMGLALEETGGRLTTIEIDASRHSLARKNIQDAGLSGRVTLIRGDAHAEAAKLRGPFISCLDPIRMS